jgi:hypothetical protein
MWRPLARVRQAADLLDYARYVTRNFAVLARHLALAEVARAGSDDAPVTSCLCTQRRCAGPAWDAWCRELGETSRMHRKLWEFVFIARALEERGLLAPGKRGLGFGVGNEPLAAAFAARGATIVATDQPAGAPGTAHWAGADQHASRLEALNARALCPARDFGARVSFRPVDMRRVPDDLGGFDFCWSACAFEHLGDLEAGLAFVERSVACLAPGGVAVHTTEYNTSSNDETVDRGVTVLYRRRDMEALVRRLEAAGHDVAPVDWDPGDGVLDAFVDVPPFGADAHLRIALAGHVTTSFGIIVRRGR